MSRITFEYRWPGRQRMRTMVRSLAPRSRSHTRLARRFQERATNYRTVGGLIALREAEELFPEQRIREASNDLA